ncbi:hypothetical protein [Niveispirillum fermenti]|uniref:hypothetical protein n=1 Tax=Niveispirillum fermenti TaxID=1233113 RepID=UPI003A85DE3E
MMTHTGRPVPAVHCCAVCGAVAHYGYGRNRHAPLFWTCRDHRAGGERRLSLPAPSPSAAPAAQGVLL